MNAYTTEFFADCPNNGARIKYTLRIETESVILVEHILAATESFTNDFHEHIADALHGRFGGKQTLVADHHTVRIETLREAREHSNDRIEAGTTARTKG